MASDLRQTQRRWCATSSNSPVTRRIRIAIVLLVVFGVLWWLLQMASSDRLHPIEQSEALFHAVYGTPMPTRDFQCSESSRFQYRLTAFAIFRDADKYLKEWIEFHRLVGFDHFLMYNNNSTDNYREVLVPYMRAGLVTLIDFPTVLTHDIAGYRIQNTQKVGIIDGVQRFRCLTRYMGIFDIDEFFFPTSPDQSLHTLLQKFVGSGKCGGLAAWRLNFGSNNHTTTPPGLVLEEYTRRSNEVITGKKVLFNPRQMAGLHNTHSLFFYDGKPLCDEKFRELEYTTFSDHEAKAIREVDVLRINHYYTKSYQDWDERLKRGTISGNNNDFSWQLFLEADNNEYLDTTVARYLPLLRQAMHDPAFVAS
ncbi:hypothetical protein CAOG_002868 [Capsaspora owczarzaki ATCC 30864]|uniref:Glycosyltransferase family 92 protein n=1 Tax=Capsaspora owczarzaki (strain ATCC 30864) TaxID=595528 RepID=A0A0D2VNB3_CAPO3|nr:hypothetical protein CAOG_002868 [Capsaspora owczarzaki ATCC 30864]